MQAKLIVVLLFCTFCLPPKDLAQPQPHPHHWLLLATMQVAMLFLTMGNMRHEALWSLWFKQAGLLVPKDCLTAAACDTQKPAGLAHSYTTCLRSKSTHLLTQS